MVSHTTACAVFCVPSKCTRVVFAFRARERESKKVVWCSEKEIMNEWMMDWMGDACSSRVGEGENERDDQRLQKSSRRDEERGQRAWTSLTPTLFIILSLLSFFLLLIHSSYLPLFYSHIYFFVLRWTLWWWGRWWGDWCPSYCDPHSDGYNEWCWDKKNLTLYTIPLWSLGVNRSTLFMTIDYNHDHHERDSFLVISLHNPSDLLLLLHSVHAAVTKC